MSTEQLLIPIEMKAMLVGIPQNYFANIAYNYKSLSDRPLGDHIEPNFRDKYISENKGIHLHWILPEAMKQGKQDDKSDDVLYPSVPNRWHITRLWSNSNNPDGEVYSISWNIESEVLQKETSDINGNLRSPQFPMLSDFSKQYRYLGRSYLYNKAPQPVNECLENLTAVAPGLPAFSAYYPDCRNVFGFYDSMVDTEGKNLENVDVTYVVCGWYSKESQDILNGILTAEECKEKLGWSVPEKFTFPAKSLCHSTISGIKWESKESKYQSNIPQNDIDIAVGNNTAEALAALQEHKNPSGYVMERMLNLFYSSGEIVLKDKNGLLKGENKVHEDRFGKETPIVQIAIKESDKSDNVIQQSYDNYNLEEINGYYIELFNKNEQLKNLQEQVYDCWYKYVYLGEHKYIWCDEKQEAIKYQNKYIEKIKRLESEIEARRNEIETIKNNIEAEKVVLSQKLPNHLLVSQNGQNFWSPNEPVLLLSGIHRDNSYSDHEKNSEDGTLLCRSISQIISSLTIDNLQGAFDIATTANCEDIICKGAIPKIIEPLVKETFIVNTDFALKLAAKILDIRKCRSDKNLIALTEKIKKLQNAQGNRELILSLGRKYLNMASGFNGLYPEQIALCKWDKPWCPLFIKWSVNYYPDPNLLKDVPTLSNWEMDQTLTDYHFKGEILTKEAVVIQGKSILAPNGAAVTAGCSMCNLGDENLAEKALDMDVLSQTFSGINRKFIMEKTDLMLPVNMVNPNKINLGDNKLPVDKITYLLEGYEFNAPYLDEFFSPIRGGFMNIDNISIIDSFGQLKEIDSPNAAVAENMRSNISVAQANIMITPRLMQPSRINFRWLNSKSDLPQDENTAESPICGWLLPNHIDKAIMVYDQEGNLLGSLKWVKLENAVVWKDVPQNGGGTIPLPKDMNPTLYKYLFSILDLSNKGKVDMVSPILEIIDSALWNINPDSAQQYNSLAQYVGRPLMIINSSIKLEQRDIQKGFKHLETRIDTGGFNSNIDVTKTKFKVQIGRLSNHGDGVIGFFKDNNYDTMYITSKEVPRNEPPIKNDYFNTNNNVDLTIGDEHDTKLTVIMDFAASIDLISGFLPTKTVKPNDYAISQALDKIYFTIFSSPILGDIDEFSIPYPKLDGREWRWLHYREGKFVDDEILNATEEAYFPYKGVCAEEGWLKLKVNKVSSDNEDRSLLS